ncbi:hypothetical protein EHQ92_08810 [Leptospira biflexa]|jgi:hypothetical protein|uniref:Outer membrane protein beta-barrel domain-containing protein n=1 Tax=Leptospira biflexa serovar Patoc (strain Patoc 1 / ATCC 23582 / Paris) TaxID=456481 RepID=B0SN20_LEPBP|nr:hypothetical protein [Leptospira biflexa]ABZ93574.1 Hypothetical protein LBF_1048 [Leptospira biflexa serovar Patoc strain 'Patoc 1 (Ames)']ABZ97207.1 Hypothetical protein; putative membrane protein; putative signal peptide [Leptospira biflexa serovar Patoc strain 'Patoc 1 (Paris)']TGM35120.1 hypothetical protein EHQ89_11620 [Leptospira biflexa]TGM38445.1 hypothetical protein EHQ80_12990 [Leptospira biflexa]TGM47985.1 hypothetical protein EHQ92_08810 [Leptospira biflexa]
MKTNLILIYFVFLVTNISMAEPAGKKEDKGTINQQTQQNEDKKIDDAEVEKYYAKLKYPPGFYQGAFLISFMGGGSLAPSGSFISHEKNYDSALQYRVVTKEVSQDYYPQGVVRNQDPGLYFKPTYTPGVASQFDFEYGWKEKIGLGFTVMQNSLKAKRQDIIPGLSYYKEYVDPFPRERTIYRGNSMSFLATYHPIPRNFFDPYLVVRAGVVSFTGEAHAGLNHDKFVYSNQISSGIGSIVGVGGGLNIYLGRYFGIKAEVDYYREFLKADQFSMRTLNSYQAMIGVFVNLSNVQYRLEQY